MKTLEAVLCILCLCVCSGCSDSGGSQTAEVWSEGPYWGWGGENGAEKYYAGTLLLHRPDTRRPRAAILVSREAYSLDMKSVHRVLVEDKIYDLADETNAGGVYRLDIDAGKVKELKYDLDLLLDQLAAYDPHSGLPPELLKVWDIRPPPGMK